MDIHDLFHSPEDTIAKFAEMQVHLYRHDVNLQNYFHALDEGMFYGVRRSPGTRVPINRLLSWPFHGAYKASQVLKPKKVKTDILFCPTPYFARKTENRFVARTLLGLAQTGGEILCLLPAYTPFRQELESELAAAGYSKQVRFLDPGMVFNPVESRMRSIAARFRGRAAFEKIAQILEPHGLTPTRHDVTDFEKAAQYVEAWERLAPSIEFDAVVARCHWYEFCSPICHTGIQRGKPVITFQQGVVGHTLDVPIIASKFVAFGAPSASILAQANRRFFDAAELPEPPVDYFNAGSLFDTLLPLPNQFSLRTILLIDLHSVQGNTWGDEGQAQALLQLAEELLASKLPLRRVVIRPHPQYSGLDLEACLKLAREHRDVCELSHPIWSLEDDLRRSSVVVGIWSGALTVASACGLPTIFLETEQGFRTSDLACFSPEQTLLPDAAIRELNRLLTEPQRYAEARKVALRNAGEYYANGANAALDGDFFSRLLSEEPMKNAEQDRPK
jgi:hypothetical protein